MIVITGERGEGKTEALIKWVMQGHPEEVPFLWSRFIVTMNHAQAESLRVRLARSAGELQHNGWPVPSDPRLLVISRGRIHTLRGCDLRKCEYALDDAGDLISGILSNTALLSAPSIISISGTAISARTERI